MQEVSVDTARLTRNAIGTPERSVPDLQHNERTSAAAKCCSAAFILAALGLLIFAVWRLATVAELSASRLFAALLCGWLLADLLSGLVHWAADTWGRVDTPWLGRRLLHPFRVHHVNPRDILGRGFLDLNGDVAAVCMPFLALACWLPLDTAASQWLVALLTATAGLALPTNQIHQWAHQPRPARVVRWLQGSGLILTPRRHARHHANPAGGHYCITSGSCNQALDRLRVFPALEWLIGTVTGLVPRGDPATLRGMHDDGESRADTSSRGDRSCAHE